MGEKGNNPSAVRGGGASKQPVSSPAAKLGQGYPDHTAAKIEHGSGPGKVQAGYPDHPVGKLAPDAASKLTSPPPSWAAPADPHVPPAAPGTGLPPVPPYVGGFIHHRDDRDDEPPASPPSSGPGS